MKKATVPVSEEAVVFLYGWEVEPRFQPVLNLTGLSECRGLGTFMIP